MFFLSPTFSATWISCVKSNCYFATGVADTDNATELLEMARFVHYLPRHHMVIRSAKKPTLKDAALLNRALLWLSPHKKVNAIALVSIFFFSLHHAVVFLGRILLKFKDGALLLERQKFPTSKELQLVFWQKMAVWAQSRIPCLTAQTPWRAKTSSWAPPPSSPTCTSPRGSAGGPWLDSTYATSSLCPGTFIFVRLECGWTGPEQSQSTTAARGGTSGGRKRRYILYKS